MAATPLAFYLGVPIALALCYAFIRAGASALMSIPNAILFWLMLMLPSWWAANLVAKVAHVVLRPWAPPLWLLCAMGSFGQALILSPAYRAFYRWAKDELMTSGQIYSRYPLPAFTWDYFVVLFWAVAPGAGIFVALSYFYDRVLGLPRLRYTQADEPTATEQVATPNEPSSPPAPAAVVAESVVPPPPILEQSRLPATAQIHAVTAEEHYVRVFSDAGPDLVRYRFSDVLAELAQTPSGMQVHRSWWVRVDRAIEWHLRGRSLELEFAQGLRVPVSLAYREAVLALAPPDVRARSRSGARTTGASDHSSMRVEPRN